MTRKSQPRTGKMFRCSNPNCKRGEKGKRKMFYAAPSRATIIERDGVGYCSPECKYEGKRAPKVKCANPSCSGMSTPPDKYCSLKCYHEDAKGRRREKALVGGVV